MTIVLVIIKRPYSSSTELTGGVGLAALGEPFPATGLLLDTELKLSTSWGTVGRDHGASVWACVKVDMSHCCKAKGTWILHRGHSNSRDHVHLQYSPTIHDIGRSLRTPAPRGDYQGLQGLHLPCQAAGQAATT